MSQKELDEINALKAELAALRKASTDAEKLSNDNKINESRISQKLPKPIVLLVGPSNYLEWLDAF